MEMHNDPTGTRIVNNVLLTAVARVSMALTLPVVSFLFLLLQMLYTSDLERVQLTAKSEINLVQQQLTAQQQTFDRQMGDVLKRLGELAILSNNSVTNYHSNANRINVLETNRAQDVLRIANTESTLSTKYDRLTDAVSNMSSRIAELAVEVRGRSTDSKKN